MTGYFDWNATAPLHERGRAVLLEAYAQHFANPSALYGSGRAARQALESAREEVAALFGAANAEDIVFCSGASEAHYLLLHAALRRARPQARLLLSPVEHASVQRAALDLWGEQRIDYLPVDADGRVEESALGQFLDAADYGLVSVQAAQNETGVVQPWRQIAEVCRRARIPYHCDAVQLAGKGELDGMAACGMATLSAHKWGGPRGVGIVFLHPDFADWQLSSGGGQEGNRRAGTENVAAIMAATAVLAHRCKMADLAPQAVLRQRCVDTLRSHLGAAVIEQCAQAERLPNTLSLVLPYAAASRWILQLDRMGFSVGAGSACSSVRSGISAVQRAMGTDELTAQRVVRISSGWETTERDWQDLTAAILVCAQKLHAPEVIEISDL